MRRPIEEKLRRHPRYASQLAEHEARRKVGQHVDAAPEDREPRYLGTEHQAKPTKHRNQRVEVNGEVFDSKLEQRVCQRLRATYGYHGIIRQVSLPIGLQRMRPDFLIIHEVRDDGTFVGQLADAKGRATKDWESKARKLEKLHGLTVLQIKA